MIVTRRLYVLSSNFRLRPFEAQAAEYAAAAGREALERQWAGSSTARRRVERALGRAANSG